MSAAEQRPATRRWQYPLAFLVALLFCFWLTGALPGLTASTATSVGHEAAVQCLANHGLGSVPWHCPDVGLPVGEKLGQGLPVFLVGWAFTLLPGISAHAAVVLTDLLIVTLALYGAQGLLRRFGIAPFISLIAGALFLVSPSVLSLASFGGTYWGMLLLPAILLADAVLFERWTAATGSVAERSRVRALLLVLWLLLQLSVMLIDGYTTVFTTVAAALLLPAAAHGKRLRMVAGGVLAYAGATLVAYAAYSAYVPGGSYARSSLDLVRAMGLDVISLVVPSNALWWGTLTGHPLNVHTLWGDGSNSIGNYLGLFSLLLAGVAVAAGWRSRRALIFGLLGCCVVGIVLGLGPSLKVDVRRPLLTGEIRYNDYLMPAAAGTLSLPTSALHESAPGVNQIRASYRWFLLTRFGLIALGALGVQALRERSQRRGSSATPVQRAAPLVLGMLAVVEILPNVAHLSSLYRSNDVHRSQMTATATELRRTLPGGSTIIFASSTPAGDDYLASLLAPAAGLRTYNIGDDRARAISAPHWPMDVKYLIGGQATPALSHALHRGEADAVVIPRFSLRWSVYDWPPSDRYTTAADRFAKSISALPDLQVRRLPHFYVVTLKPS